MLNSNKEKKNKKKKEKVLIKQIAGTELWSTVVYLLKMAHNFNLARDEKALFSVLLDGSRRRKRRLYFG